MSLIIAGERSGVGKTTVTLALLAYLQKYAMLTQSFKVGPDYIDPMFHRYVTGRPCRNLDPVLTSEGYVQCCFTQHTQAVEYALVEGVMGLFDGTDLQGVGGFGSTAHVARLLNLPVLLVVDCSRMSQSIAALVHGYTTFDPNLRFAGLVLNRVGSDRHLTLLKAALAPLSLPILGILRRHAEITIPDRHLGLLPTAELSELDALVQQLAHLAQTAFDWSQLMPLLKHSSKVNKSQAEGVELWFFEKVGSVNVVSSVKLRQTTALSELSVLESRFPTPNFPLPTPPIRIAIAQDAAFSFYYEDNFDLLKALGAELVFWSPLQDENLPEDVQGLILGGGFPEMFAAQLAANQSARQAVKQAIAAGMPTYAECGGLMYLCQKIVDFEGNPWEMVGILPTTTTMGQRLTLGYRRATALQDGVILPEGAIVWGHEFHRSHIGGTIEQPLFQIDAPQTKEGYYLPNLHASYIHLHWGSTPQLAERWIDQCQQFQMRCLDKTIQNADAEESE